jgi:methionyl-tRNA formyltransferase
VRYVLFATPRFGALVLRELAALSVPPALVVANPDRPFGRKQVVTPPPARVVADELGIPCLQPEKLDADVLATLREVGADVFVVAAYGKILKPDLLAVPPCGTIGVHPSLLPAYRGPSPMQQALIDGASETGVSLFLVDDEVDHGPVLASEVQELDGTETYLELEEQLAQVGANLLVSTLAAWVSGAIDPEEQDHAAATFTRKFSAEDAHVSFDEIVEARSNPEVGARLVRLVHALNPEPGTWTERAGVRVKLLAAELQGGKLAITEHQVAGKTPTSEPFRIA